MMNSRPKVALAFIVMLTLFGPMLTQDASMPATLAETLKSVLLPVFFTMTVFIVFPPCVMLKSEGDDKMMTLWLKSPALDDELLLDDELDDGVEEAQAPAEHVLLLAHEVD